MATKYLTILALPLALINAQVAGTSQTTVQLPILTSNTYFHAHASAASSGTATSNPWSYATDGPDSDFFPSGSLPSSNVELLSIISKVASFASTKTRDRTFQSVVSVISTANPTWADVIVPTGAFTTEAWFTVLPNDVKSYVSALGTEMMGLIDPTGVAAVSTGSVKKTSDAAMGASGLGMAQVSALVLSGVAGMAMIWL
jgi:hypothetical protein